MRMGRNYISGRYIFLFSFTEVVYCAEFCAEPVLSSGSVSALTEWNLLA